MIYLDNAATTNYKPQEVLQCVYRCLTKFPYNPNRGNNIYAHELQQQIGKIRKRLALLFNNDGENHVAFTSGCTQALNLAILGNARRGHLIVSATEHNSVLRPAMQLQRRGLAEVSVVVPREDGQIYVEDVAEIWRKNTYMLCVSHASNVNGNRQRLHDLGNFVRQHEGIFLVDCAQSVGYFALDMQKDCVDLAAIGAHKGLHAMQGAGALVYTQRAVPNPIVFGGTGTESHLCVQPNTYPDCLESGTPPTPAICAMGAGIDWWLKNWQQNADTVADTQRLVLDGLKLIKHAHVYSQQNKSGIVAFNLGNADSNAVADMLAQRNIAVRGGLQCAPLMHKYLGTFHQGVVRASTSCVTTKQQCFEFLNAVDDVAKQLDG